VHGGGFGFGADLADWGTVTGVICNFVALYTGKYEMQSLILVQACNQAIWCIRSKSNDDCYFIFNPFHLKYSTYFTFNPFHIVGVSRPRGPWADK
jgi:hypothetical protein